MANKMERGRVQVDENVVVDNTFTENPRGWLTAQAKQHALPFLLAHAEDGVLWGKFEKDALVLAGDVFPNLRVALATRSLLDARVFGAAGELFVWKADAGWRARYAQDGVGDDCLSFEEQHWLWGTPHVDANGALQAQDGFTLLVEGAQGMRHAPPLTVGINRRAALLVRHYVEHDAEGQAFVAWSRLVKLEMAQEDKDGSISK